MHSSIEKMLLASANLPANLSVIFRGVFCENKTPEQVCREQNITPEDYADRLRTLMRDLRAAAV